MYNEDSNPTVISCTFIKNTATLNGGGMANFSSSPTVTNTGFCGNTPDQIAGTFTDGGGNSMLYCPPPIVIDRMWLTFPRSAAERVCRLTRPGAATAKSGSLTS